MRGSSRRKSRETSDRVAPTNKAATVLCAKSVSTPLERSDELFAHYRFHCPSPDVDQLCSQYNYSMPSRFTLWSQPFAICSRTPYSLKRVVNDQKDLSAWRVSKDLGVATG